MASHRIPPRSRGFTLIELAVVVGVVGLLLGALLVPLSTQYEVRQLVAERRQQQNFLDALVGFAMVNRRLPCPDNDADGLEDVAAGVCAGGTPDTGFLPWVTLGVKPTDTWGHLYFYHVMPAFVQPTIPGAPAPNAGLDLLDLGGLTVQDRREDKTLFNLTTDGAAVIGSAGPNGHGAINLEGATVPVPPSVPPGVPILTDQLENMNAAQTSTYDAANVIYVARQRTAANDPCDDTSNATTLLFCEFDDILTWLPANVLKLRLVEAGALP